MNQSFLPVISWNPKVSGTLTTVLAVPRYSLSNGKAESALKEAEKSLLEVQEGWFRCVSSSAWPQEYTAGGHSNLLSSVP